RPHSSERELEDLSRNSWTLGGESPLQIPHPRTVQETGDQAVLAHLEHRAEPACDEGGGGPGTFGGDWGREVVCVVPENSSEGEQAPRAVGGEGSVEAGEGLEDRGGELGDVAAAGEVVQCALGKRVAGGE